MSTPQAFDTTTWWSKQGRCKKVNSTGQLAGQREVLDAVHRCPAVSFLLHDYNMTDSLLMCRQCYRLMTPCRQCNQGRKVNGQQFGWKGRIFSWMRYHTVPSIRCYSMTHIWHHQPGIVPPQAVQHVTVPLTCNSSWLAVTAHKTICTILDPEPFIPLPHSSMHWLCTQDWLSSWQGEVFPDTSCSFSIEPHCCVFSAVYPLYTQQLLLFYLAAEHDCHASHSMPGCCLLVLSCHLSVWLNHVCFCFFFFFTSCLSILFV